jgi:bifunctional N-acetylglucosamine-1-phosphate-uridyltransferase/glucosamine-1-phosphate-acetyltransferase GlmU-like protein
MKRYMIVVAGGKGQRMGGTLPKQFQLLGERPVLMVTLERLYSMDKTLTLYLYSRTSIWVCGTSSALNMNSRCRLLLPKVATPVSTL